jgi:bifunctional UDP-N-acetylglucosamine pyrophosphorylase/glucosamine-1-phosphate N-acetyltransferase
MFGGFLSLKAIVLAAGSGTRMKSDMPKCAHKVLGRTMLNIVLDTLQESGISEIVVVTGHKEKELQESVTAEVQYAHQAEQLGTGHAVMMAKEFLTENDDVLVLCGDAPLVTAETICSLCDEHKTKGNAITVVSTRIENPYGYGRIVHPAKDEKYL